jgi:hypothetical protein
MGEVILLTQTLHPFRGRLRIEHDGKNVSIDTIKLVIKIKLTVIKKHNIFMSYNQRPTYPFLLSAPVGQQELHICCVILLQKSDWHSRTYNIRCVTVSNF